MKKTYWRITYRGIGVYEALKREIWNNSSNSKKEWEELKKSQAFTWLKTPDTYAKDCYSYFTELGYKLFEENTYSVMVKYLKEEEFNIEEIILDDSILNIVYKDEHQIVIEK